MENLQSVYLPSLVEKIQYEFRKNISYFWKARTL